VLLRLSAYAVASTRTASFEIGSPAGSAPDDSGPPTKPEVRGHRWRAGWCGGLRQGESDSICPGLPKAPSTRKITLAEVGGKGLTCGEYSTLATHPGLRARRRAHDLTYYITRRVRSSMGSPNAGNGVPVMR